MVTSQEVAGGCQEQNTPTLVKVVRIDSMMRAKMSQQVRDVRYDDKCNVTEASLLLKCMYIIVTIIRFPHIPKITMFSTRFITNLFVFCAYSYTCIALVVLLI